MGDAARLTLDRQAIPSRLRDRETWVCWREETRDGDPTKVPVDPAGGGLAKANDPETWGSFEKAVEYHSHRDTDTAGIGFMFSPGGPFVGVDLDHCRDPDTGDLDPWAAEVVDSLDSYSEVSPSGTGIHVIVEGDLPDDGNRHGDVEIYDGNRFFTVTGQHVEGTPATIDRRQNALESVHAEYVGRERKDTGSAPDAGPSPAVDLEDTTNTDARSGEVDLTDKELIAKAKDAENGDRFRRLWNGDTSGYPSHSEADLALCSLLAFWTGGDWRRIDRLFRRSGLNREKWDRDDYRKRTIDKAVTGRSEFYDPSRSDGDGSGPPDVTTALDGDHRDADSGDDGYADSRDLLSPTSVRVRLGIDPEEGEQIADLSDREKAAVTWQLIRESEDCHVRVRRENGDLWAYDGGVWTPEGERALRHAARRTLGPVAYGQNVLKELKGQARADPEVEVEATDLGLDPGHVAVENGLLDLDAAATGEGEDALRDLRPEDYALARLPVEYDPGVEYETWAEYVGEWAEDGKADALQEYVGYCLHVGAFPIHRALLLVGSGANGKGTFLSVVRALLGRDNTTSIELQTLANERDAVADFYGSLANIDDDLSARKLGNGIGMFKKLVGGDRVRGRHLYEDAFEFDATGKHLYAANQVPDVSGDVDEADEAFWRRWLLVEFPNHYPPSKRDPDLTDRLTADDSLSGVLNWAIEGRQRLLDQGYFTGEHRFAQGKRERWQAWGDSVDKFISECVDRDPDAENKTTGQVHRVYAAWCREHGEKPVGQQQLTMTLKNEEVGYSDSLRVDGHGTPQRGYKALALSGCPDVDDTPERGRQSRLS